MNNPPEGDAAVTPRRGSRHLHAFLDSLLPGLGHLAAGRRRRAALFGIPTLVTIIVVVGGLLLIPTSRLLGIALDPATVVVLFGLQALLLVWRAAAIGSSLVDGRFPRLGRRDALPIALLAVVLVAPHGFAAYATEVAREATDQIIPIDPTTTGAWDPSASASAVPDPEVTLPSEVPASPSVPSSASPSPAVPRQNVLLVGVDAGVGRNTYLTDTMIVVSLDPVGQTVSMISIPRDMVDVPLPDGRTFSGKINGLVSFARHHQGTFPGSNGKGYDVLMGALGTLLGLRIDHYAAVNLQGFVNVVDTLGGIDVDVADGFCDPTYDEYGFTHGFGITAGRHHLNGQQALGYARIRKAAGESDFTRAARQQEILSGIRDRVKSGGFLNDPIGLLRALSDTVETNIPRKLVPDLADIATKIGRKQTYRAVITHPLVKGDYDGRGSIQVPDVAAIRKLVAAMFPATGTPPP
ncbi:MAG TPA: LCP family protein, partial [Candidatus Limnocylindrales bacterium]|nr:LCP family protein [Candidatus Limnocylindrales bacterium]